MKNVERRDRQLPYISDAEVMEQQMNARRLTQKLNTIDRSDFDGIAAIVKELFGKPRVHLSIRHFTVTMAFILRLEKISLQIITAPFSMWQR